MVGPETPITASVIAADPRNAGAAKGGPAEATVESPEPGAPDPSTESAATIVVDLPETPGHTGGAAARANPKPAKPQRPKFLNSRE